MLVPVGVDLLLPHRQNSNKCIMVCGGYDITNRCNINTPLNVYETAAVTVQIRNLVSSRCAVVEGMNQAHVGHAEGNWRNLQSWKYARYSSPSYVREIMPHLECNFSLHKL